MDVSVVASSLVGFVLPHERNELLGLPAFSLEVIVVRCRCTGVPIFQVSLIERSRKVTIHHEVDGTSSTKNVGAWYNSLSSSKPVRCTRLVECCSLAVKFHVTWVCQLISGCISMASISLTNSWTEDPWVV